MTPKTKVVHVCHITNLTGQIFPVTRDLRVAARARHRVDRRRRARVRALPVQVSRPRLRLLRHEPAQVALAPVGTGFLYVRRERIAGLWPLMPAPRVRSTATSASSRRSARTRRRTTSRSPRPSLFHQRSARSARQRACATCASAGPIASRRPAREVLHQPTIRRACGSARRDRGHRPGSSRAPLGTRTHHHRRDQARRSSRGSASRPTCTRRSKKSTRWRPSWSASSIAASRLRPRSPECLVRGGGGPFELSRELVPQAVHGEDVLRVLGVLLDLLPQPGHVDVDGPCVGHRVVAPDVVEQLIA